MAIMLRGHVNTHHKSGGAHTGTCGTVAVSSIGAATRQHAPLSIVARRAGLIAVESCPSCRAGACARQRVAAGNQKKRRTEESFDIMSANTSPSPGKQSNCELLTDSSPSISVCTCAQFRWMRCPFSPSSCDYLYSFSAQVQAESEH